MLSVRLLLSPLGGLGGLSALRGALMVLVTLLSVLILLALLSGSALPAPGRTMPLLFPGLCLPPARGLAGAPLAPFSRVWGASPR